MARRGRWPPPVDAARLGTYLVSVAETCRVRRADLKDAKTFVMVREADPTIVPLHGMNHFIYEATDESATARLGAALADVLPDGATVALCGTLGAGKTRLVQAIAEAVGVDRRDVLSPTFVLIQEYHGRRSIYHIDAYRLRDDDEFLALGPEEYFDGDGLVLVEWADRVAMCLPKQRVEIHIEVTGADSRRFDIVSIGEKYAGVVARLSQQLGGLTKAPNTVTVKKTSP